MNKLEPDTLTKLIAESFRKFDGPRERTAAGGSLGVTVTEGSIDCVKLARLLNAALEGEGAGEKLDLQAAFAFDGETREMLILTARQFQDPEVTRSAYIEATIYLQRLANALSSPKEELDANGLRACPWCASHDHLSITSVGSMTGDMPARPYRVICTHLDHDDVSGPVAYGRAAAIAAWNTRASTQAAVPGKEDLSECSASGQVGEGDAENAAGRGEDKVGLGWKLSVEARQQLEKIEQANTHNATGLGSFLVGSEHPNGPGERGEG